MLYEHLYGVEINFGSESDFDRHCVDISMLQSTVGAYGFVVAILNEEMIQCFRCNK